MPTIFLGIPLGLLAEKTGFGRGTDTEPLILPPGAREQTALSRLCTRCYACVSACPTGVIRVKSDLQGSFSQLFQPVLLTEDAACDPECNRCCEVCSAGAIAPLTLAQKRRRQIGIAQVDRDLCMSWAANQPCMVCRDTCVYEAVVADDNTVGVQRPIVIEDTCRGCGACQNDCPCKDGHRAIRVIGVDKQRVLAEAPPPDKSIPDAILGAFREQ